MGQDQNDWEKEREEREKSRWRAETARKIYLMWINEKQEGSMEIAKNCVALADYLIKALR